MVDETIVPSTQRTEVRFSSFLSGGFTIMAVINPPEMKLAKRTSVQRIILKIVGFQEVTFDFLKIA